jgi:pyridinium-3,5-bisthiocarboxylic acid mononucleotide nickel chelatase
MTILYIDPVFGISGDMTISALLDAGCPFGPLDSLLQQIPLPLPPIVPEKKTKGIVAGTCLRIGQTETHLSVKEMTGIIGSLNAEEKVKGDALAILNVLVEAESKIHEVPRDQVHFHELSHVDTLIDVICTAQAIRSLGIDKVYCGPVPQGRGFVRCSHGVIPNPPPVTMEILKGFPLLFFDRDLEMTTPTGAAILRHYVSPGDKAPPFSVRLSGCGFGTYETDVPNVLRVFIGEEALPSADEEVWVIETDMDDCELEYMGAVAERLRSEGALDVLYFPVYMKKGRIGIRLSVTVAEELLDRLTRALFSETTTFGLRLRKEKRNVLKREETVQETSYGPIRVKKGYDARGTLVKTHIEYEDVRKIADEQHISYRLLLDALKKEL